MSVWLRGVRCGFGRVRANSVRSRLPMPVVRDLCRDGSRAWLCARRLQRRRRLPGRILRKRKMLRRAGRLWPRLLHWIYLNFRGHMKWQLRRCAWRFRAQSGESSLRENILWRENALASRVAAPPCEMGSVVAASNTWRVRSAARALDTGSFVRDKAAFSRSTTAPSRQHGDRAFVRPQKIF